MKANLKSQSADLAVRGESSEGGVDKLAAPERLRWVAPLSQRLTLAVMRGFCAASLGLTIWLAKIGDEQLYICTSLPCQDS